MILYGGGSDFVWIHLLTTFAGVASNALFLIKVYSDTETTVKSQCCQLTISGIAKWLKTTHIQIIDHNFRKSSTCMSQARSITAPLSMNNCMQHQRAGLKHLLTIKKSLPRLLDAHGTRKQQFVYMQKYIKLIAKNFSRVKNLLAA